MDILGMVKANGKLNDMRIGACGCACEVCEIYIENYHGNGNPCPGCTAGNARNRRAIANSLSIRWGECDVLECAIEKYNNKNEKVGFCTFNCDKFPCKTHYKAEVPYGKRCLDESDDALRELRGNYSSP